MKLFRTSKSVFKVAFLLFFVWLNQDFQNSLDRLWYLQTLRIGSSWFVSIKSEHVANRGGSFTDKSTANPYVSEKHVWQIIMLKKLPEKTKTAPHKLKTSTLIFDNETKLGSVERWTPIIYRFESSKNVKFAICLVLSIEIIFECCLTYKINGTSFFYLCHVRQILSALNIGVRTGPKDCDIGKFQ